MLSSRERAAMRHPDKLGAGAKKRKYLTAKEKGKVIEAEWNRGTLHSGSGAIVPHTAEGAKQMTAIKYSEMGRTSKKKQRYSSFHRY